MELKLTNPHSIQAILNSRPQDIKAISGFEPASGIWKEIFDLAKSYRVKIIKPLANSGSLKQGRESHFSALVLAKPQSSLDQFFKKKEGIWFAIDCVQDPHNLGAIFRSAAFFGVNGIAITKDRTAELSAVVYDTACGGVESINFIVVGNLVKYLGEAKSKGLWILGTSERAATSIFEIKKDRPRMIVFGNEQSGLRRLTQEACDEMCKIPTHTDSLVTSLNVGVSAGILAYALGTSFDFKKD